MASTLFLTAFQPFISRNILYTGVLDELLARGLHIVLFVPQQKAPYYKDLYATDARISVEGVSPEALYRRRDHLFKNFAQLLINTNTKRYHRAEQYFKTKNLPRYVLEGATSMLLRNGTWIKRFFRGLERRYNFNPAFVPYFEKYKPDGVFATDMFGDGDLMMLKTAARSKVAHVGMVLSWDNLTSKGLLRFLPQTLIVQNDIIKDEAIRIHAVPSSILTVSGIPHYDFYTSYKPISRTQLFSELGITDPATKLVFVSPAGSQFIGTDWQTFEMLKRAQHAGKISRKAIFMISQHPTNPLELGSFSPGEHFIMRKWGVSLPGVRLKDTEFSKEDIGRLLNILCNVDLVINVVSSMAIDAAVLDRPIITIGFNGWEKQVPFSRSVDRFLSEENMAKLLASGGTHIVRNEAELIAQINTYLDDPSLDRDARRQMALRQCWKLDGKGSTRIADAILSRIQRPYV